MARARKKAEEPEDSAAYTAGDVGRLYDNPPAATKETAKQDKAGQKKVEEARETEAATEPTLEETRGEGVDDATEDAQGEEPEQRNKST